MDRMEEVIRAMRSAQDARLYARGQAEGRKDGRAAGEAEGWEAGYAVAMTGTAIQER